MRSLKPNASARQSDQPHQYPRTTYPVQHRLPTSFDPGLENPVGFVHVKREESMNGSLQVAVQMAEMPKPLLNSVSLRVRAWFVPMTAFDRYPSVESFYSSWSGVEERVGDGVIPVAYTGTLSTSAPIALVAGLQYGAADVLNLDFVEAYNHCINHERKNLNAVLFTETERALDDLSIARASFVNHLFADVKPTFDEASAAGIIDLNSPENAPLSAATAPIPGFYRDGTGSSSVTPYSVFTSTTAKIQDQTGQVIHFNRAAADGVFTVDLSGVTADLSSALSGISLAEIDRGRTLAQLAQVRDRFAGHEEVHLIDQLMAGFHIPHQALKSPILLNEQRTVFGTMTRQATDGASLDQSVTEGLASVAMSLNLPSTVCGGYIVVTVTAQPDQIFERRRDPMLWSTSVDDFPDAFRDTTINIHKVEVVKNGDIDHTHATPNDTYGYAPMNMRFARPVDRVGGKFRDLPANAENRASLWLLETDNPVYGQSHLLCPSPFPKSVFADTLADAFEARIQLQLAATGITQFGPSVLEDQGSYDALLAQIAEAGA